MALSRSCPSSLQRAHGSARFILLVHFLCFSSSFLGGHAARPSTEETGVELPADSRGGASRSSLAEVAAEGQGEAGTGIKSGKVLYMANGDLDSAKGLDAALSKKGLLQVHDRVKLMLACPDALATLQAVEEVFVRPRLASMQTAIVAVAVAWSDLSMAGKLVPTFRIEEYMHPDAWKVPAALLTQDIRKQLMEFTQQQCRLYFGEGRESVLDEAVEALVGGYSSFLRHRTNKAANTVLVVYKYIHEFKYKLYGETAPVLVIGASDYASLLFMTGLPKKKGSAEDPLKNLQRLVRENVVPLNHAGVIRAEWMAAAYRSLGRGLHMEVNRQTALETVPYFTKISTGVEDLSTGSLPNFHPRTAFSVPFDVMNWVGAEVKGLLPFQPFWRTFILQKQKFLPLSNRYSDFKQRLMSVSAYADDSPDKSGQIQAGFISWMTVSGMESKGSQDISKLTLEWIDSGWALSMIKKETSDESLELWVLEAEPGLENHLVYFKSVFDIVKDKVSRQAQATELFSEVASVV